jgi:hypothetical protein
MTQTVSIELTPKELNYIEMALLERIRDLEDGPLRDAGNVPHIRWFSKRVANKIRRQRGYPAYKWTRRGERKSE